MTTCNEWFSVSWLLVINKPSETVRIGGIMPSLSHGLGHDVPSVGDTLLILLSMTLITAPAHRIGLPFKDVLKKETAVYVGWRYSSADSTDDLRSSRSPRNCFRAG
jgi:hypothetical protein